MKKKGLILGLYLSAALAAVGCGNQVQEEVHKPQEEVSVSPEEMPEAEETEESQEEGPREATGTVKSFTGSYLSVVDDDGEILGFEMNDSTLECENGILAGDLVTVTYEVEEGEFGIDNEKALRVIDPEEKPELEEYTVTGTVTDVSSNSLTVQREPENPEDFITFFTVGTEFHCKHGLGEGNRITVTYKGELYGNSARNVKVLSVYDGETEDVEELEEEQKFAELTARIVKVEDMLLVVEAEEEDAVVNYEFDLSTAAVYMQYGLLQGSEVNLKYQGVLNEEGEEPILLEISGQADTTDDETAEPVDEETDEEKEPKGCSITGTVMTLGENAITITSDDGAQITCTTEADQLKPDETIEVGSYVIVILEPNAQSNIHKALSIDFVY